MPIDLEGEIAEVLADCAMDDLEFPARARAVLARLDALGLVVVPKEPTEEMVRAAYETDRFSPLAPGSCYRAMISASKP